MSQFKCVSSNDILEVNKLSNDLYDRQKEYFMQNDSIDSTFDSARRTSLLNSFNNIIKNYGDYENDCNEDEFIVCIYQLRKIKGLHYALIIICYSLTQLCDNFLSFIHDGFLVNNFKMPDKPEFLVHKLIGDDKKMIYLLKKQECRSYILDLVITQTNTIVRLRGPKKCEEIEMKNCYFTTLSFIEKVAKNIYKNFNDYEQIKNNCKDYAFKVYSKLIDIPSYDFDYVLELCGKDCSIVISKPKLFFDEQIFLTYLDCPQLADAIFAYLSFIFHDAIETKISAFKTRLLILFLRTTYGDNNLNKRIIKLLIEIETTEQLRKNSFDYCLNIDWERQNYLQNEKDIKLINDVRKIPSKIKFDTIMNNEITKSMNFTIENFEPIFIIYNNIQYLNYLNKLKDIRTKLKHDLQKFNEITTIIELFKSGNFNLINTIGLVIKK